MKVEKKNNVSDFQSVSSGGLVVSAILEDSIHKVLFHEV